MMGLAETTGLVLIIVAVFEGLLGLIRHLISKNSKKDDDSKQTRALKELAIIKEKILRLDDMHYKFDAEGTPMWYVPRGWGDTQEKIIDRLESISQIELKMLGIIERLERRVDSSLPH